MPAVCLYFQIHQPFRLRKYTVFDSDSHYFDEGMNSGLVKRIAERCYVPMGRLLLDLIERYHGKFKFALSVTGVAIEQFEMYAPEVVQGLHALANTGQVEFLSETYSHSLSALYSEGEFKEQVAMHRQMIKRLFNQTPVIFRNTELIYSNAVARLAGDLGFKGILAEGWEPLLNNRSASFLYKAVGTSDGNGLSVILRNHRLSDVIAFQFTDAKSPDFPLTPEKFAAHVGQIGGQLCNLFMDYETFGEHQSAGTGIFDFVRALPGVLLGHNCEFATPSELVRRGGPAGELDVPSPVSWADVSRDLGAWAGNAMQGDAIAELYALERAVKSRSDSALLNDWRKLTTSDHVYYMSTKRAADGGVHAYFRPYESPYDAYINFMNVIENLRMRSQ